MKQLLFLILLYSIPGVGQTTTTYYKNGYGGTSEKVGYSETRPTQSQFSPYTIEDAGETKKYKLTKAGIDLKEGK